nr:hypothetical protein [Tanacetum cinerariifolium]
MVNDGDDNQELNPSLALKPKLANNENPSFPCNNPNFTFLDKHLEMVSQCLETSYNILEMRSTDTAYPPVGYDVSTLPLRTTNGPSCSITNWETLKTKFLNKYCPPARTVKKLEEINNFQQEPDESLFRALDRFKELLMKCPHHYLTDIQEVGYELWKGPHYTKDCPLKEEGKTLEGAYYTQFGAPYQPGGQYRAARLGFYQCNNGISSYPNRSQTLEESLTKFMAEPSKRHKENSNIIKEIRDSTDAAIRNQGATIKTLEIQERGIRGLPGSTETNLRDHVKLTSTAKANSSTIRRIRSGPYVVSDV